MYFCKVFSTMNYIYISTILVTLFLTAIYCKQPHFARLSDPPMRRSLWRHGYRTLPDLEDGAPCSNQTNQESLKCSICGEGPLVGPFIVKQYIKDRPIEVKVTRSSQQKGHVEFSMCTKADDVTEECFNHHVMDILNTKTLRTNIDETDYVTIAPPMYSCTHCVLRWRFTTDDNVYTYVGCADVEIVDPVPEINDVQYLERRKRQAYDATQQSTTPISTVFTPSGTTNSNSEMPGTYTSNAEISSSGTSLSSSGVLYSGTSSADNGISSNGTTLSNSGMSSSDTAYSSTVMSSSGITPPNSDLPSSGSTTTSSGVSPSEGILAVTGMTPDVPSSSGFELPSGYTASSHTDSTTSINTDMSPTDSMYANIALSSGSTPSENLGMSSSNYHYSTLSHSSFPTTYENAADIQKKVDGHVEEVISTEIPTRYANMKGHSSTPAGSVFHPGDIAGEYRRVADNHAEYHLSSETGHQRAQTTSQTSSGPNKETSHPTTHTSNNHAHSGLGETTFHLNPQHRESESIFHYSPDVINAQTSETVKISSGSIDIKQPAAIQHASHEPVDAATGETIFNFSPETANTQHSETIFNISPDSTNIIPGETTLQTSPLVDTTRSETTLHTSNSHVDTSTGETIFHFTPDSANAHHGESNFHFQDTQPMETISSKSFSTEHTIGGSNTEPASEIRTLDTFTATNASENNLTDTYETTTIPIITLAVNEGPNRYQENVDSRTKTTNVLHLGRESSTSSDSHTGGVTNENFVTTTPHGITITVNEGPHRDVMSHADVRTASTNSLHVRGEEMQTPGSNHDTTSSMTQQGTTSSSSQQVTTSSAQLQNIQAGDTKSLTIGTDGTTTFKAYNETASDVNLPGTTFSGHSLTVTSTVNEAGSGVSTQQSLNGIGYNIPAMERVSADTNGQVNAEKVMLVPSGSVNTEQGIRYDNPLPIHTEHEIRVEENKVHGSRIVDNVHSYPADNPAVQETNTPISDTALSHAQTTKYVDGFATTGTGSASSLPDSPSSSSGFTSEHYNKAAGDGVSMLGDFSMDALVLADHKVSHTNIPDPNGIPIGGLMNNNGVPGPSTGRIMENASPVSGSDYQSSGVVLGQNTAVGGAVPVSISGSSHSGDSGLSTAGSMTEQQSHYSKTSSTNTHFIPPVPSSLRSDLQDNINGVPLNDVRYASETGVGHQISDNTNGIVVGNGQTVSHQTGTGSLDHGRSAADASTSSSTSSESTFQNHQGVPAGQQITRSRSDTFIVGQATDLGSGAMERATDYTSGIMTGEKMDYTSGATLGQITDYGVDTSTVQNIDHASGDIMGQTTDYTAHTRTDSSASTGQIIDRNTGTSTNIRQTLAHDSTVNTEQTFDSSAANMEQTRQTMDYPSGASAGQTINRSYDPSMGQTIDFTPGIIAGQTMDHTEGVSAGQPIDHTSGASAGQTMNDISDGSTRGTIDHTSGTSGGQTMDYISDASTGQTIDHTSGVTTGQTTDYASGASTVQARDHGVGENTVQSMDQTYGNSIGQTIDYNSGASTGERIMYSEGKATLQTIDKISGGDIGQSSDHGIGASIGQTMDHSSGTNMEQRMDYTSNSQTNIGETLDHDIGASAGQTIDYNSKASVGQIIQHSSGLNTLPTQTDHASGGNFGQTIEYASGANTDQATDYSTGVSTGQAIDHTSGAYVGQTIDHTSGSSSGQLQIHDLPAANNALALDRSSSANTGHTSEHISSSNIEQSMRHGDGTRTGQTIDHMTEGDIGRVIGHGVVASTVQTMDHKTGDSTGPVTHHSSGTSTGHTIDHTSGSGTVMDYTSGTSTSSGAGTVMDYTSGASTSSGPGTVMDYTSGISTSSGAGTVMDYTSDASTSSGAGTVMDYTSGASTSSGPGTGLVMDYSSGASTGQGTSYSSGATTGETVHFTSGLSTGETVDHTSGPYTGQTMDNISGVSTGQSTDYSTGVNTGQTMDYNNSGASNGQTVAHTSDGSTGQTMDHTSDGSAGQSVHYSTDSVTGQTRQTMDQSSGTYAGKTTSKSSGNETDTNGLITRTTTIGGVSTYTTPGESTANQNVWSESGNSLGTTGPEATGMIESVSTLKHVTSSTSSMTGSIQQGNGYDTSPHIQSGIDATRGSTTEASNTNEGLTASSYEGSTQSRGSSETLIDNNQIISGGPEGSAGHSQEFATETMGNGGFIIGNQGFAEGPGSIGVVNNAASITNGQESGLRTVSGFSQIEHQSSNGVYTDITSGSANDGPSFISGQTSRSGKDTANTLMTNSDLANNALGKNKITPFRSSDSGQGRDSSAFGVEGNSATDTHFSNVQNDGTMSSTNTEGATYVANEVKGQHSVGDFIPPVPTALHGGMSGGNTVDLKQSDVYHSSTGTGGTHAINSESGVGSQSIHGNIVSMSDNIYDTGAQISGQPVVNTIIQKGEMSSSFGESGSRNINSDKIVSGSVTANNRADATLSPDGHVIRNKDNTIVSSNSVIHELLSADVKPIDPDKYNMVDHASTVTMETHSSTSGYTHDTPTRISDKSGWQEPRVQQLPSSVTTDTKTVPIVRNGEPPISLPDYITNQPETAAADVNIFTKTTLHESSSTSQQFSSATPSSVYENTRQQGSSYISAVNGSSTGSPVDQHIYTDNAVAYTTEGSVTNNKATSGKQLSTQVVRVVDVPNVIRDPPDMANPPDFHSATAPGALLHNPSDVQNNVDMTSLIAFTEIRSTVDTANQKNMSDGSGNTMSGNGEVNKLVLDSAKNIEKASNRVASGDYQPMPTYDIHSSSNREPASVIADKSNAYINYTNPVSNAHTASVNEVNILSSSTSENTGLAESTSTQIQSDSPSDIPVVRPSGSPVHYVPDVPNSVDMSSLEAFTEIRSVMGTTNQEPNMFIDSQGMTTSDSYMDSNGTTPDSYLDTYNGVQGDHMSNNQATLVDYHGFATNESHMNTNSADSGTVSTQASRVADGYTTADSTHLSGSNAATQNIINVSAQNRVYGTTVDATSANHAENPALPSLDNVSNNPDQNSAAGTDIKKANTWTLQEIHTTTKAHNTVDTSNGPVTSSPQQEAYMPSGQGMVTGLTESTTTRHARIDETGQGLTDASSTVTTYQQPVDSVSGQGTSTRLTESSQQKGPSQHQGDLKSGHYVETSITETYSPSNGVDTGFQQQAVLASGHSVNTGLIESSQRHGGINSDSGVDAGLFESTQYQGDKTSGHGVDAGLIDLPEHLRGVASGAGFDAGIIESTQYQGDMTSSHGVDAGLMDSPQQQKGVASGSGVDAGIIESTQYQGDMGSNNGVDAGLVDPPHHEGGVISGSVVDMSLPESTQYQITRASGQGVDAGLIDPSQFQGGVQSGHDINKGQVELASHQVSTISGNTIDTSSNAYANTLDITSASMKDLSKIQERGSNADKTTTSSSSVTKGTDTPVVSGNFQKQAVVDLHSLNALTEVRSSTGPSGVDYGSGMTSEGPVSFTTEQSTTKLYTGNPTETTWTTTTQFESTGISNNQHDVKGQQKSPFTNEATQTSQFETTGTSTGQFENFGGASNIKTEGILSTQYETTGTQNNQVDRQGTLTGQYENSGTTTNILETGQLSNQLKGRGTETSQFATTGSVSNLSESSGAPAGQYENLGSANNIKIAATSSNQFETVGTQGSQYETSGTPSNQLESTGTVTGQYESLGTANNIETGGTTSTHYETPGTQGSKFATSETPINHLESTVTVTGQYEHLGSANNEETGGMSSSHFEATGSQGSKFETSGTPSIQLESTGTLTGQYENLGSANNMETGGMSSTDYEASGTQRSQFETSGTPSNHFESRGTLAGQYESLGSANNIETGGISSSHFEASGSQGSKFETSGTPSNQLERTGTLTGQYENLGSANNMETGGMSRTDYEASGTQRSQFETSGTPSNQLESTATLTGQYESLGSANNIETGGISSSHLEATGTHGSQLETSGTPSNQLESTGTLSGQYETTGIANNIETGGIPRTRYETTGTHGSQFEIYGTPSNQLESTGTLSGQYESLGSANNMETGGIPSAHFETTGTQGSQFDTSGTPSNHLKSAGTLTGPYESLGSANNIEAGGMSSSHYEVTGTQEFQFETLGSPSNRLESTGTLTGQYESLGTANNMDTGGKSSSHFDATRTQGSKFETSGTPSNQLERTGTLTGQYESLGSANNIETGGISSSHFEATGTQGSQFETYGTPNNQLETTGTLTGQYESFGRANNIETGGIPSTHSETTRTQGSKFETSGTPSNQLESTGTLSGQYESLGTANNIETGVIPSTHYETTGTQGSQFETSGTPSNQLESTGTLSGQYESLGTANNMETGGISSTHYEITGTQGSQFETLETPSNLLESTGKRTGQYESLGTANNMETGGISSTHYETNMTQGSQFGTSGTPSNQLESTGTLSGQYESLGTANNIETGGIPSTHYETTGSKGSQFETSGTPSNQLESTGTLSGQYESLGTANNIETGGIPSTHYETTGSQGSQFETSGTPSNQRESTGMLSGQYESLGPANNIESGGISSSNYETVGTQGSQFETSGTPSNQLESTGTLSGQYESLGSANNIETGGIPSTHYETTGSQGSHFETSGTPSNQLKSTGTLSGHYESLGPANNIESGGISSSNYETVGTQGSQFETLGTPNNQLETTGTLTGQYKSLETANNMETGGIHSTHYETTSTHGSQFETSGTPSNRLESTGTLSGQYETTGIANNIETGGIPSTLSETTKTQGSQFETSGTPSNPLESTGKLTGQYENLGTANNMETGGISSSHFEATGTQGSQFESLGTPSNRLENTGTLTGQYENLGSANNVETGGISSYQHETQSSQLNTMGTNKDPFEVTNVQTKQHVSFESSAVTDTGEVIPRNVEPNYKIPGVDEQLKGGNSGSTMMSLDNLGMGTALDNINTGNQALMSLKSGNGITAISSNSKGVQSLTSSNLQTEPVVTSFDSLTYQTKPDTGASDILRLSDQDAMTIYTLIKQLIDNAGRPDLVPVLNSIIASGKDIARSKLMEFLDIISSMLTRKQLLTINNIMTSAGEGGNYRTGKIGTDVLSTNIETKTDTIGTSSIGNNSNGGGVGNQAGSSGSVVATVTSHFSHQGQSSNGRQTNTDIGPNNVLGDLGTGQTNADGLAISGNTHTLETSHSTLTTKVKTPTITGQEPQGQNVEVGYTGPTVDNVFRSTGKLTTTTGEHTHMSTETQPATAGKHYLDTLAINTLPQDGTTGTSTTSIHNAIQSSTSSTSNNATPVNTADMQSGGNNFMSTESVKTFESLSGVSGSNVVPVSGEATGMNSRAEGIVNTYDTVGANSMLESGSSSTKFESTNMGILGSSVPAPSESIASSSITSQDIITKSEVPVVANGANLVSESNNFLLQTPDPSINVASDSVTILESTGAGYVTHSLPQVGGFVAMNTQGVEGNNHVAPETRALPLNSGLNSDVNTLESFNANSGFDTIATSVDKIVGNTEPSSGSLVTSDNVRQSTSLFGKPSSSVSIPLSAGSVGGQNDMQNQGLYTNTETIGKTGELANVNTGSGISHGKGSETIVHSSGAITNLDASPLHSSQVFDTTSLTDMTHQFAEGTSLTEMTRQLAEGTSLAGVGKEAKYNILGDSTFIQTGSPIDNRITLTGTESKSPGETSYTESGASALMATVNKQNSGSTIGDTGVPTSREAVGSISSGSTINVDGTEKQLTSAGSPSLTSQEGSATRNIVELHSSSPSNLRNRVFDTLANGDAVMQNHHLFNGNNGAIVDMNTNMLEFVPKKNAFTASNSIPVKTSTTGNTLSNAGSSLMPGHSINGLQMGIGTDIHTHTLETVPTGPFTEGSSLLTTGQFNAISTQTDTGSQFNGGSTLTETGNQITGGSVLTDTGSNFYGGSTLMATGSELNSESKLAETGSQLNSGSTLSETGRQLDSGLTQINTGGRFNQDSMRTGSQLSLTRPADQSTGRLNDGSTLTQTGSQLTGGSTLYVAGGQINSEPTMTESRGQINTGSTLETGRLNDGSALSETGSQIDAGLTLTGTGSLSTGGSMLTETGSGFNARSMHTESGGQMTGGLTANEANSEFAGSSVLTGLSGQTGRISSMAGTESLAVTGPGGYISGRSTLTEGLAGQHAGSSISEGVKAQHGREVAITGVRGTVGSADSTSGGSTRTEVTGQFAGSFNTPSMLKNSEKSTGHSGISSVVEGGRIGTNTVLGSESQNLGGPNIQYEHLGGSGAGTKATSFTATQTFSSAKEMRPTGTMPGPSLNAIGSDFGTSNIIGNSQTSFPNANHNNLLGSTILANEGIRQNTDTSFMPHQEPHNAVNSNTRVTTRTTNTVSSMEQKPSSFSDLPPPPHSFLMPAPVHGLLVKTQKFSTRSSSPLSFDQTSTGSSVGNTLERAIKRTSTGSSPITNTRVTSTSTRSSQPNWSENALGSGMQVSSQGSKKAKGTIRSSSSSLMNTASSSLPQKNTNSLWELSKDLISRRQLLSNAKALANIGLLRGGATDINSILNSLSGTGSSNTLLSRTTFNTQPAETAIALDSPRSIKSLVTSRATQSRFNSPARSTAEQKRLENILNGRMTTNIPSLSYSVASPSPNEIVRTTKHTSTSLTSSSLPPISSGLNSLISSLMRNGPGIPAQHLQRANVQLGSIIGLSGSKARSAGKSTTSLDGKIKMSGIGTANNAGNRLQLGGNKNNVNAANTLMGSSSNLITSSKNNENIIRGGVNNGNVINYGNGIGKVDITSTMNGNSGGGNTNVVTNGDKTITEVSKQQTVNGATTKTRTTQTRDGGTGGIRSSTTTVTTRTTNRPGTAAFHKGGTLASNGVSSDGFRSTTSSTTIISGRESQSVCPGQSLMCGAKGTFSNTIGSNLWCINSCLIDRRMCRSEKCECSCTPTMRYYQQVIGAPGSSSSGTTWNNGQRTLKTSGSFQTQKPFGTFTTFGKSSITAKPFGSVQTVETFKTTKSFGNTKLSDSRNGFGNGFSGSNVLSGSTGRSNSGAIVQNVSPSGSSDRRRGTSGVQTENGLMQCMGRGAFETVKGMIKWCETSCSTSINVNNCHPNTCKCWYVT